MTMTLIEAIKENDEKEFFELLSLKENPFGKKIVDEVDPESEGGALYWAAACGRLDFIAPLIKAGADVNKADKYSWTPTYIAAYYGRAEIITALKAGCADVDKSNNSGVTPVCAAAYTGGAEAITALKAAGANVNTPEVNGLTPIYIAVQMKDVKVIKALLEAGANVNTKTPHGTPLELAKQGTTQRDQDVVRLLEAHLQQYPNGIKTLAANSESTQLNQEPHQENFAVQVLQYDNPNVEAKAGRDVITVTGGIRGQNDMATGGGNTSSSPEAECWSDNPQVRPEDAAEIVKFMTMDAKTLQEVFHDSTVNGIKADTIKTSIFPNPFSRQEEQKNSSAFDNFANGSLSKQRPPPPILTQFNVFSSAIGGVIGIISGNIIKARNESIDQAALLSICISKKPLASKIVEVENYKTNDSNNVLIFSVLGCATVGLIISAGLSRLKPSSKKTCGKSDKNLDFRKQ